MEKKYLFQIVLTFFLLPVFVSAQNELRGKVTEANTGVVLDRISVFIPDLNRGDISDSAGTFRISNLPSGQYTVIASAIGFSSEIFSVTINQTTTKDFSLRHSSAELKAVVVTGVLSAQDNNNVPFPVSTFSHQDLLQESYTNVIDAISKIPGVSAITDGQSISKPVIRGMGYNRVVTVADGVSQQGQQWGDEFGIEVDPDAVNRVEILKGPGSLVYGSDAISGVINFLPEAIVPEGQVKGDLLFNYQFNNGLIGTMAHLAGHEKDIFWSVRADNTMAHAYKNPYDGYVLNSQFSNFNTDATIGVNRSWGYSKLHFGYFQLATGIVEGTRDSATGILERQFALGDSAFFIIPTNQEFKSYTPLVINQLVRHQKLVWDNSIKAGDGRVTAIFAWQQNRRQENNDPTVPNTSNIDYLLNTVNYDLRYISGSKNNFTYSAGVNGLYQNSKNKGTLLLIPEYDLFSLGGFFIVNKTFGKWILNGGLRYDWRTFKGHDNYIDSNGNELSSNDPDAIHRFTAYTSDFNGPSGSLGFVYHMTNAFDLKANVSRGFRAANVAETGSNGIHDGTVVYEIGDPNLKPETNRELDISATIHNPNLSAEIDLFGNWIDNYIYPKPLQSQNGGDSINNSTPGFGDAPVFKYTQGTAMLVGGEVVLDIHPQTVPWLDWYNSFSLVDAVLKNEPDSSKYPPFIPPPRIQSELRVDITRSSKTFRHTYFKLGFEYDFKQTHIYDASSIYMRLLAYELAASQAPTKGYTLINLGAGTDFLRRDGSTSCSLYLVVNNLFDVVYIDYMSRFKYYPANFSTNPARVGVYNMGRNLSLKLTVPLSF
jgi:iron complex outermembrane recepter protein